MVNRVEKGEVLNPHGRPKGSQNFKTVFRKIFDTDAPDDWIADLQEKGKLTQREALALKYTRAAFKDGNLDAFKFIVEHAEGKPKETDEQGGSLNITLNVHDLNQLSESVQNLLIKKQQPKEVIEVKAEESVVNPCNMPNESH